MLNPVILAQELIRCPSITPIDAGVLGLLEEKLKSLGFECHRKNFEESGTPSVDNLWAKWGSGAPHFCFAGHTDVVPVGDLAKWTHDPFAAVIEEGVLWGRGAADMKGAIAAFVAAVARFQQLGRKAGSISLLITNDEEGPAINGTDKVLNWLEKIGEKIDYCVVGEPTNEAKIGDMAKIGRRGSINGTITVKGSQGHVAYPHLADNPIPILARIITDLAETPLDHGSEHFPATTLAFTSVDVGNDTSNVIPAIATARFNVRFNDHWHGAKLQQYLADRIDQLSNGKAVLTTRISGESFVTLPGRLSEILVDAVQSVTGLTPQLSTTGGTSDARFIRRHCPVVEFGLVNKTIHKVDEHIAVQDIDVLADIYLALLKNVFA